MHVNLCFSFDSRKKNLKAKIRQIYDPIPFGKK
jgi:hypothetical protein